MLKELSNPEWRDCNENRKYPFSDNATLVNSLDQTIDIDLFDDARLHPIGGDETLYLSSIVITLTTVSFYISTSTTSNIASGTFEVGSAPSEIELTDQYNRPAGILVSTATKLDNVFGTYGISTAEFSSTQTPFATSVIVPMPARGVTGFLLDDGTILTGDVYLVGTDGVVLIWDGTSIVVNIVGDPYALIKDCQVQGVPLPTYCGLKTINGIGPNDNGDFKIMTGSNIASDNVLRIEQDQNVIKIKAVGSSGTV